MHGLIMKRLEWTQDNLLNMESPGEKDFVAAADMMR